MIRLRWPGESIAIGEAAQLVHPRLRRLRGAGPWAFAIAHGGPLIATMQVPGWTAEGWPEAWTPGTDGCEYQLAANPPPIAALQTGEIPAEAEAVDLLSGEGERVWVLPARRAPRRIGPGLADLGPATAYGAAAHAISERLAAGSAAESEILDLVLMAARSVHRRLLPEIVLGRGLIAHSDVRPILEAAWRIPKAQPGAAT